MSNEYSVRNLRKRTVKKRYNTKEFKQEVAKTVVLERLKRGNAIDSDEEGTFCNFKIDGEDFWVDIEPLKDDGKKILSVCVKDNNYVITKKFNEWLKE